MNINQLITYLKEDESFLKHTTMWITKEAKAGNYINYPDGLDPRLIDYYQKKGIEKLYTHQRSAIDLVMSGKDIVVVTPTASGKTLCYNIPVLNHMLNNPESRALYLFPTKALSQDQMNEIVRINDGMESEIRTYTFDGDTPASARKAVRDSGNIVVSNPDMLHAGILPHHTIWIKLFENLKYVVIDELHMYRGVFGSHLANLIRRLKRICKFYGSNPQFVLCSATINNPKEHAEKLIEKPVELIDNNGAPSGERHYVVYNPPVINKDLGIRASSVKEAAKIGANILNNKIPLIVFARSRMRVEVISTYLKERCRGVPIVGYRGGYLPNERRRIELGLRDGSITGVVSTNALELGIDIGMLDAAITTGYPGSISSLYQQFGRAGRRSKPSLAIMVATSSALDQYIAANPKFLTESNPENATINPDNLLILMDHLKCAAFELPFKEDESFAEHLSTTQEMLQFLEEQGILKHVDNTYHWMNQIYPANEISLRTASQENVVIIDTTKKNKVIGEVDLHSAPTLVHDDAIYIHQGIQYYVDNLDWERRTAFVHETDSEYYTDANVKVDLHVIGDFINKKSGEADVHHGEVNVREKAMMFKKIRFHTHENLGWAKIHLPELESHSTSCWIDIDEELLYSFNGRETGGHLLYALSYLFHNIAPVFTFCDVQDIKSVHMARSNYSGKPSVFLYDSAPGGSGISERIYQTLDLIITASIESVSKCTCSNGCPGCIGPIQSDDKNLKAYTVELLTKLSENSVPGSSTSLLQ
jgi:DEAD/DEAH box helicase domain-containing protein